MTKYWKLYLQFFYSYLYFYPIQQVFGCRTIRYVIIKYMAKQSTESPLETNIAVMGADLKNLIKSFEEYKVDSKKFVDTISTRVNDVENANIETKTRVSNFAIFQTVFSLLIGAIASYLGVHGK